MAMLLEPGVADRERAQAWLLRLRAYRPTTLHIPAIKRLGARIGTAHIAFDDQPFERRMRRAHRYGHGRFGVRVADRSGLGSTVQVIDATPPQRPPAATASATRRRRRQR